MNTLNTLGTVFAIVGGGLVGLYIYKKYIQPRQKGELKKLEEGTTLQKTKVNFERVDNFSYEQLAEWISTRDIADLNLETKNYGCGLFRYTSDDSDFFKEIDLSNLSSDDKSKILVLAVINTQTNQVKSYRWMICKNIHEDVMSIIGDKEFVIVK